MSKLKRQTPSSTLTGPMNFVDSQFILEQLATPDTTEPIVSMVSVVSAAMMIMVEPLSQP